MTFHPACDDDAALCAALATTLGRRAAARIQIARVDELAAARWPNPLVTIDGESVADAPDRDLVQRRGSCSCSVSP